jgi:hypothetical protein
LPDNKINYHYLSTPAFFFPLALDAAKPALLHVAAFDAE